MPTGSGERLQTLERPARDLNILEDFDEESKLSVSRPR